MLSGNAAAALLAFWLGRYFDRREWEELASGIAASTLSQLAEYPSAVGGALQVAELALAPRRELAIVGDPTARRSLEAEAASRYLPALLLAPAADGLGLPILEGRGVSEGAAAYLCEEMVCELPVFAPAALAAQLERLR